MIDGAHDHLAFTALAGNLESLADRVDELAARVAVLETPPPVIPQGAVVLQAGQALTPKAGTTFVLRGGLHHLSWGSAERHEAGMAIMGYPGEPAVLDGTGAPFQNIAYLGTGATWALTDLGIQNFRPTDSGLFGIGDGCDLQGLRVRMVGLGAKQQNIHGVYGHGTGTATFRDSSITKMPGAAGHSYRGSARLTFINTELGGLYISVLGYSGVIDLQSVRITETTAAWDIQTGQYQTDPKGIVTADTATKGTGTNGAIRRAA